MTKAPARNINRTMLRKPPSEINTNRYIYYKSKLNSEEQEHQDDGITSPTGSVTRVTKRAGDFPVFQPDHNFFPAKTRPSTAGVVSKTKKRAFPTSRGKTPKSTVQY